MMSDEFSYVWLLPLLEKPFEAAAIELPDAVRILQKKYTLPTEISLQPLVLTALVSHSEYWAGLALQWLEDGFPQIPRLLSKLKPHSDRPDIPDSERSFLPDKLSLNPWLMPIFSNGGHGGVLHDGGGLGWISRSVLLSLFGQKRASTLKPSRPFG